MKIICQIGVVFAVCWVSQLIEAALPFPFPASVIGMVLLLLLLANMAFFFLPAGVSIMNYFDLLRSSAVALVVICLVTTVVTFAATAWSIRLTLRLLERRKNRV